MKEMLSNYFLGTLACIVMGIALIIRPLIITEVLNTAIGVILIAWAALGILKFFISRSKGDGDVGIFSLLSDIVILGAGIYVFVNPDLLVNVVMISLGLYLLFSGLPKIFTAFKIKSIDPDRWLTPFITSMLTTILGVVMILCPTLATDLTAGVMRLVGVVLVVAGVTNFMGGFSGTRLYKKLQKDIEYSGGRGRDKLDTSKEDKAKAIDVDPDDNKNNKD